MHTITLNNEQVEWLLTVLDNLPYEPDLDKDHRPVIEYQLNRAYSER